MQVLFVGWQTISLSDSRELLSMELLLTILQCSLECHRVRYYRPTTVPYLCWWSGISLYLSGITNFYVCDDLLLFRAISTQSDYCALRNDVAAIEKCSSSNSLNFIVSKCKHMVISRKRTLTTPASPILLNGIPLERIELFEHLGVVVSSDLS